MPGALEQKKILWVDDEIDSLRPHILFLEQRGYPVKVGMSSAARSDADARELWTISEYLTGVSYL